MCKAFLHHAILQKPCLCQGVLAAAALLRRRSCCPLKSSCACQPCPAQQACGWCGLCQTKHITLRQQLAPVLLLSVPSMIAAPPASCAAHQIIQQRLVRLERLVLELIHIRRVRIQQPAHTAHGHSRQQSLLPEGLALGRCLKADEGPERVQHAHLQSPLGTQHAGCFRTQLHNANLALLLIMHAGLGCKRGAISRRANATHSASKIKTSGLRPTA